VAVDVRSLNPYYSPFLYRWGQRVCGSIFRTVWRCDVRGIEHVQTLPPGPVIFAANHRSYIDPPLIGSLVPHTIFYFAKEELFAIPLIGWYIRRVNSFPVRRSAHDVGAFKTALDVLHAGYPLLLFPEGGRRLDPRKQWAARAGVGMLAAKTGASVIPVGLLNTEKLGRLAKIEVRFGAPIPAPGDTGGESYQNYADLVMSRIRELCQ
jgi:1-acyl-sn-glycerol-3-phosphate acyltransferase